MHRTCPPLTGDRVFCVSPRLTSRELRPKYQGLGPHGPPRRRSGALGPSPRGRCQPTSRASWLRQSSCPRFRRPSGPEELESSLLASPMRTAPSSRRSRSPLDDPRDAPQRRGSKTRLTTLRLDTCISRTTVPTGYSRHQSVDSGHRIAYFDPKAWRHDRSNLPNGTNHHPT